MSNENSRFSRNPLESLSVSEKADLADVLNKSAQVDALMAQAEQAVNVAKAARNGAEVAGGAEARAARAAESDARDQLAVVHADEKKIAQYVDARQDLAGPFHEVKELQAAAARGDGAAQATLDRVNAELAGATAERAADPVYRLAMERSALAAQVPNHLARFSALKSQDPNSAETKAAQAEYYGALQKLTEFSKEPTKDADLLRRYREYEAREHERPTLGALTSMAAKQDHQERIVAAQTAASLPNEVAGEGLAADLQARNPRAVPDHVATAYLVKGNKYLDPDRDSRIAFVDHGNKLQTGHGFDGRDVRSMVDVAEARGWDSMKVTGDPEFRRAVWHEAASRGIEVKGYSPSESEIAAARAKAEASGKVNRIELNPTAKAYLEATDRSTRSAAAKEHPELRAAFALEAAMAKFANTSLRADSREVFLQRQRENIAKDLSAGKPLPEVELRQSRQQLKELDRVHENER